MAKNVSGLPGPLVNAARRINTWRRKRTTHRIPEDLWSLAANLGGRFGVSRTARALRVDYSALKKRVAAAPRLEVEEEVPPSNFVEILATPTSATTACWVEFESSGGSRMRIQVKGASGPDLAELSRLFLERCP